MEINSLTVQDYWAQIHHLVLEGLLIVWVLWLVTKKSKNNELQLPENEKDALVRDFEPESLVGDVMYGHHALRNRIVYGKVGKYVNVDGVVCVNFCSHNYLGLLGRKKIETKTLQTITKYGVGSCGPRGFYGTSEVHLALEKRLAEFMGVEDAVVYAYGFATVSSAIPAYCKRGDIIFADEKCNFAIQKGLDASRSAIKYFKHNNVNSLKSLLEDTRHIDLKNKKKAMKSRRFLVIEGIYAYTGEICPLPELITLCKKYKLRIFIEESISFGVLGRTGRGVTEYYGINRSEVDLVIASMENSLATVGGFCTGSSFIVDHQRLSGLGYCFSASLPPLLVTAAMEGLNYIDDQPNLMDKLKEISSFMYNQLTSSSIINQAFQISGHPHSPVLVLYIKIKMKHHFLDKLIETCLRKKLAVSRVSCVDFTDRALAEPCLRITASIYLSREDVHNLINILEIFCCKFDDLLSENL